MPTQPAPHPPFTAEHAQFRAQAREFIASELTPHADEWEAAEYFPDELFPKVGDAGYFGLKFEERWGGSAETFQAGTLRAAIWALELARCGSGGVAAGIGAHSEIAAPPIWKFGTDEQRERWLVPAIKGENRCALGITEPGAGSDVAGMRTRAEKVDGGYVVNGEKTFITNGVRFDLMVTALRTGPGDRHAGISFLVIEKTDGVTTSALHKLGWQASDTGTVALSDVFVPAENLLGAEDQGFALIMANFQWERLQMSLGAVGGMEHLIEITAEYAAQRNAFGKPLLGHQSIRHKLAELDTTLNTARALTFNALGNFAAGHDVLQQVTMSKLVTQRAAVDVADACLQIHGGLGTLEESGLPRALRDARLGPIGGGTDEIMRELVGRTL
ncbi:MAG: acyl-CoA dehydrogenase family protein [Solirubrobacteraceae bacterium]|nr:acyl-CoA dehydrogenase family protein [Solirubrobacteraceae bacterium]